MNPAVKIGDRWIGEGHPCFIVAEAGSNHNGKLDLARKLIEVAAEAKVDAVKFQLFRASKLYPKKAGQSDYLKMDRPIYDIITEMEMPYEWLPELAEIARRNGLCFLASAFDEESVDRLDPFVPAFKIASYEMTHLPLVRAIARKGKPVIMATGTATLEEVRESVNCFRESGNRSLVLMQCTAAYPAPLESLNVRAQITLAETFGVPTGLSDHSRDPLVGPIAAAALGAHILEKHFTLSNQLPGPDHAFALESQELQEMVRRVREVERARGDGRKIVQPVESELREFARRQVVAVKEIGVGESFTRENAAVLRRGKMEPGLEPKYYDELLGKTARRRIPDGSSIRKEDYA